MSAVEEKEDVDARTEGETLEMSLEEIKAVLKDKTVEGTLKAENGEYKQDTNKKLAWFATAEDRIGTETFTNILRPAERDGEDWVTTEDVSIHDIRAVVWQTDREEIEIYVQDPGANGHWVPIYFEYGLKYNKGKLRSTFDRELTKQQAEELKQAIFDSYFSREKELERKLEEED